MKKLAIWNSHINDLYRLGFWDGCTKELYAKLEEHINGLKANSNRNRKKRTNN